MGLVLPRPHRDEVVEELLLGRELPQHVQEVLPLELPRPALRRRGLQRRGSSTAIHAEDRELARHFAALALPNPVGQLRVRVQNPNGESAIENEVGRGRVRLPLGHEHVALLVALQLDVPRERRKKPLLLLTALQTNL